MPLEALEHVGVHGCEGLFKTRQIIASSHQMLWHEQQLKQAADRIVLHRQPSFPIQAKKWELDWSRCCRGGCSI